MSDDFNKLEGEEKMRAENEFLKMKMMLELGADVHFSSGGPPEIENQFLKYVMALEAQSMHPVFTTVFKKIESPSHFKPVNEIADTRIDAAFEGLLKYLNDHGISLTWCSPKVTSKELYRFIVEELFQKQIDDIRIPGVVDCFIYDEFYPDHEYENTRAAVDECIRRIFSKNPFEFLSRFNKDGLRFNKHERLSEDELKILFNRFKELFEEIHLWYIEAGQCLFNKNSCSISGHFGVDLVSNSEKLTVENNWKVDFLYREDCGYWFIVNVQLEGIDF